MNFLKYVAITSVTIAAMSLLIHGGAFGEECTYFEDGSNSCNKKINENQWDCNTMGNKICGPSNDNDNKKSNNNDNDNDNHKSHKKESNNNRNPTMYEDQLTVCDMWNECVVINIDDYLSAQKREQLEQVFSYDINTFSVSDLN